MNVILMVSGRAEAEVGRTAGAIRRGGGTSDSWWTVPAPAAPGLERLPGVVRHVEGPIHMAGGSFLFDEVEAAGLTAAEDNRQWLVELYTPLALVPAASTRPTLRNRRLATLAARTYLPDTRERWLELAKARDQLVRYAPVTAPMRVAPALRRGGQRLKAETLASLNVRIEERPHWYSVPLQAGTERQTLSRRLEATREVAQAEYDAHPVEPAYEGDEAVTPPITYRWGAQAVDHSVAITSPRSFLPDLSKVTGLLGIHPRRLPIPALDHATVIVGVPGADAPNPRKRAWTGLGEIVAITDTGYDDGTLAGNRDLRGRVLSITTLPFLDELLLLGTPTSAATGADGPQVTSGEPLGHGTHAAGVIAGDGALGGPMGVAPQAQILFQAAGHRVTWKTRDELGDTAYFEPWPPPDYGLYGIPMGSAFRSILDDAYAGGARVHNLSLAFHSEGGSGYSPESAAVDAVCWEARDFTVVISAGNQGRGEVWPSTAPITGTVTSPATSKNGIAVGASENVSRRSFAVGGQAITGALNWANPLVSGGRWDPDLVLENRGVADNAEHVAPFSGRGPASGRIKPDLVAPGTLLTALRSRVLATDTAGLEIAGGVEVGNYVAQSGSSVSASVVSGAVALVRECLRRRYRQSSPSSALIRALLAAAAAPLTGPFSGSAVGAVNSVAGFGRLSLGPILTDRFAFSDSRGIKTGERLRFRATITRPDDEVVVALAWRDPPSIGGGLVNHLALRVFPGATAHTREGIDGDLVRFPAVVNNLQRVRLPGGHSTVTVEVVGVAVNESSLEYSSSPPRSDFALVVLNATRLSRSA